jgi:uncharacterized membrane protein SpoIIM required for sporulation
MTEGQQSRWKELSDLLNRLDRQGHDSLEVSELKRLCHLYRHVVIDLSRTRATGEDPELERYLNLLATRAHGHVYWVRRVDLRPLLTFLLRGFPRLIRRRALPVLITAGVFFLASLASFVAVVRNPEWAYSLFDEQQIEFENIRLEKQQGEYRSNFDISGGESPYAAVKIIANNIRVAAIAFALGAALCLPGILLLVFNGRMLGTLSGLVWNYGFFLDFYALILTHGVLELSAICISGAGGLMLGWAILAPGRYSRRDALRRAAPDAFGLFAGAALLLIVAGHIEAYVTPHFSQAVRWSVAAASAVLFAAYIIWAGKAPPPEKTGTVLS